MLIQDTLHPSISPSIDVADVSHVAAHLQWLNDFLMLLYYGAVNMVMRSILIAVVNAAYSSHTALDEETGASSNEAALLVAKYNILKYMECFYSSHMLDYRRQYCAVDLLDRDYCPYDEKEGSPENELDSSPYIVSSPCDVKPEGPAKEGKRLVAQYSFQVRERTKDFWATTDALKGDDCSTNKIISLLIVDPQNDFHSFGFLPIQGADKDSKMIASFIRTNMARIHHIVVTLESRAHNHISHPHFWRGITGDHPKLFTVISHQDIRNKVWVPRVQGREVLEWCLKYTKALEDKGMRKLTVWPEHCIVGGTGHAVVPAIKKALQEWAASSSRPVKYVMKCQSWKTESYSAFEAELVDPDDFSTSLNMDLLYTLRMADQVPTSQRARCTPPLLTSLLHLVGDRLRTSPVARGELHHSRRRAALARIHGGHSAANRR